MYYVYIYVVCRKRSHNKDSQNKHVAARDEENLVQNGTDYTWLEKSRAYFLTMPWSSVANHT